MARLRRHASVDEGLPAMKITLADRDTPIGPMRIDTTPTGLCSVDFTERCNEPDDFPDSDLALLKAVGKKT